MQRVAELHRARHPFVHRGAFTLIELVVVLLILALLAAISLGLASRVTSAGRSTATAGVLRTLDDLMTAYMADSEGRIRSMVDTDRTQRNTDPSSGDCENDDSLSTDRYLFPLIDGRIAFRNDPNSPRDMPVSRQCTDPIPGNPAAEVFDRDFDAAQPSAALLLLAWEAEGFGQATLKQLDAKFIQRRDAYAFGWRLRNNGVPEQNIERRRLRIPVPMDAFGRPIRFVHPRFDGGGGRFLRGSNFENRNQLWIDMNGDGVPDGQGRGELWYRSYRPFNPATATATNAVGDADEGVCPNNRPYFYSAGPDGDPGTREDNAYSTVPQFPRETADLK